MPEWGTIRSASSVCVTIVGTRASPPDIDTDLCSRRRDGVIQHVYDEYGAERVAIALNAEAEPPHLVVARNGHFVTCLGEGMATDRQDPLGVYFGTANGEIYASRDEGESWERIAQYLPYVVSVEAASVG